MKQKYAILKRQCMVCGCNIRPKIRISDGKILSKHFFSPIDKHYFFGWSYEMLDDPPGELKVCCFKNNFYRIIGFCEFTRNIFYWIWELFHRGKIEYWECYNCGGRYI